MKKLRKQLEKHQAILAKRLNEAPSKKIRRLPVADTNRRGSANKRRRLLFALAGQQLRKVTEALERIDEGVYGQCVVCGQSIAEDRLQAMPTATHCWNCQQDV